MATQTFDTLSTARELKAAGIESGRAAAIAIQLRAKFCRALCFQAGAIIAATVALVKLIPGED